MIIYVMLPALIFKLVSITPVEEFSNLSFITATTFATLVTFCLTFFIAGLANGGDVGESTIQGFAGAYGNIGYMGPPLAIAAFGPEAAAPVALIFCFDNSLHFTLAPLLMVFRGKSDISASVLVREILGKIFKLGIVYLSKHGFTAAISDTDLPEPAKMKIRDILNRADMTPALHGIQLAINVNPPVHTHPHRAWR